MTLRTIDLSGNFEIAAVTATRIELVDPELINANWLYNDLDGVGTSGYAQNVTMVLSNVGAGVDLAGTYQVAAVTPTELSLVDAAGVNADWGLLSLFPGLQTRLLSSFVAKSGGNWIGPFIVESPDTDLLVANFVALQGLFKDNGEKQRAFPITVQLEATPVDQSDNPIGAPQTFSTTIPGNSKGRETRSATMVCELTTPGRQSVRARRTTNADYSYKGTVVDEVKWKDLYGIASIDQPDFGDVTTIHSRTYATEGALNLKERKLNLLATRKVPERISGTTFGPIAPTTNAADIFTAICLDPYIGARSIEELDLNSIYGAVDEAVAYFGIEDAGSFSYTFDDDGTSFEETASIVAQAVFSTAFRQGSEIKLALEKATQDSSLLFNHRNKVPGSETRSIRFGNLEDHDGVELEYVAADDGAPVTIYIPADRSAKNPRAIKVPGVVSHAQAYWHAWRAWNKIRYQNCAVEFTALQEAATIVRNERMLVADNTRPDTQDGEVEGQAALELELSQPVELSSPAGHTIFLQLPDGSVEAIAITPGSSDRHVVLAQAPRVALAIGEDLAAPATYQIVPNDSTREQAFLLTEKEASDNFNYTLRAVNYSSLYYANDQLELWLDFEAAYQDAGPYLRDGVGAGGASVVVDIQRGEVHNGGAGTSVGLPGFAPPPSYTKAAWIKRTNLAVSGGSILSSAVEFFGFGTDPALLVAAHGAFTNVEAPWPAAGAWHHATLTYDAEDGRMALYIDGELADEALAIAQRSLDQLTAFGAIDGRADDLRLIRRSLSAQEVRDLYKGSRL